MQAYKFTPYGDNCKMLRKNNLVFRQVECVTFMQQKDGTFKEFQNIAKILDERYHSVKAISQTGCYLPTIPFIGWGTQKT